MSRNIALNIKFTGCNPNGRGNKAATQRITLELQLETTMGLDDLKEILLNGFKVHRNDQSNYRHEFMIGFLPKPLMIQWGRMLFEIFPSEITKIELSAYLE